MPALTIREVVRRMKKYKPTDFAACKTLCNLPLERVGEGVSRTVYRVGKLPIVIKINNERSQYGQAWREHKAHQRIIRTKRFARLRPLMPVVYYFSRKTGNSVMRYYEVAETGEAIANKARRRIYNAIRNIANQHPYKASLYASDVHSGNIGITKKGRVKIVDLGFFS